MNAPFLEQIDWDRPWLAPFRGTGQSILGAADWRLALNEGAERIALRNHRDLPVRFVAQSDLPQGVAYEAFISETGGVPTRDNLHDFFNALVWLTFPKIKRQLNALQAIEIEKAGSSKMRGNSRDAATIFDENAALLVSSDPEWLASLRGHQWQEALLVQREAFGRSVDIVLFGHALLEKLVTPYKAITAHTWVVFAERGLSSLSVTEQRQWLDTAVEAQLAQGLRTGDFTPLPVLGVPGWRDGQDRAFYADIAVFRPKRM